MTKDGLKCDPNKVKAILEMPRPEDVEGVRRLCRMVNYLGKFVASLSDLIAPLRGLVAKGVAWHWDKEHEKCFVKIKQTISNTPVLAYYDETKELILSVDASSKGLGGLYYRMAVLWRMPLRP